MTDETALEAIWSDATNSVCQTMQEQNMCNCPDGGCIAMSVMPSDKDRAAYSTLSTDVSGLLEREIRAAQITMGRGLVDVSRIEHEGRAGILFRPRKIHIPVSEPGELPAGEYWPIDGDVVIWIESTGGAQVIHDYLAPFLPPQSDALASLSLQLAAVEGERDAARKAHRETLDLLSIRNDKMNAAEASLSAAQEDNERLRKALEFYRDQWEQEVDAERTDAGWSGSIGDVIPTVALCEDKGSVARATLSTPSKEDTKDAE